MGKLFIVVGSTGVGKTTLTRILCRETGFTAGLEEHEQRPFQALFKDDARYALPNQLDFLLYRMEQETSIRASQAHGIQDGGLEMDFHGFTRLFQARGMLNESDFKLCQELYTLARTLLPPPDGIIHLTASPQAIAQRLGERSRINIASAKDAELLETFLINWLSTVDQSIVFPVDATPVDPQFTQILPGLLQWVMRVAGG